MCIAFCKFVAQEAREVLSSLGTSSGVTEFELTTSSLLKTPLPPFVAMLNGEEVAKHNSRQSCWVVIRGKVYDLTAFLDDHPGGANSILKYAGKDATEEYELLHAPGTLEKTLPHGMGTLSHSPLP